ncbi:non-ribosomal peptide synthetase [Prodigiosinella confusarubida]|uniref:Non-ribosomal peptide synthetase n=1 Tax=Serratia sp. (strain ATCC 39006) TaxID=104623 RepID=A0A2I5TAB9_SERS3|nr:non-ribosomal peptide synthetase [Serratia sp. ATCC 39006]AUH01472.1 non-ribosomal peptide synthetase [Serratia sp. ATCC 39006]AUH05794.1 non-ribosomal peptide synthetase [Serratia sp. ATCC 39006]
MTNKSAAILSLSLDELKKLAQKKKSRPASQGGDGIQRCTDPTRRQFPLTSAQKSFWMLDQYLEDKRAYNNPYAVICRVDHEFNPDRARQALTFLTRKHSILRTTFQVVNGEIMQCVSDNIHFDFVYENIVAMPQDEKQQRIKQQARDEGCRDFDLARGPLSHWRIVKTSHNEYVLMLTFHHIISDGWTVNLFFKEFMEIYFQLENNMTPAVDNFLQFTDYALAESQWQTNGHYDQGLAYWKNRLDGVQGILDIVTDAPRPPKMSSAGSLVSQRLDPATRETLNTLCSHHNVTLFHALLTAWQALLYLYSGQQEIIIGIPFANRNHPTTRELMGLFMNTLPLCANIRPESRLVDMLSQAKGESEQAMRHQDVPFNMIIEHISFGRSPQVNPLFQAMLTYQVFPHFHNNTLFTIEPLKVDYGVSKTDLNLWVEEDNGMLLLTLYYNPVIFRQNTAEQMLEHFQRILRQFIANPEITVAQISLLSEQERHQRQAECQPQPPCAVEPVHRQFAHIASDYPQQPAVRCDNREMSYQATAQLAEQLAQRLLAAGLEPGEAVGLYMKKGVDYVVAIMAILSAGGCYLPLDITLTWERVDYIIADAAVRMVLTDADDIAIDGVACLNMRTAGVDTATRRPLPEPTPDSPAYIIYTSGSTGVPKGVRVNHAQLACYCNSARQVLQQPMGARYGMFSSFTTDLAHTMLFPALTSGGCLEIISDQQLQDPARLMAALTQHPLNCMKITPSHLGALLASDLAGVLLPTSLLVLGGERAPWSLIERLRQLNARCRILNHYGPTECTVGVATWEVMPDTQLPEGNYLPIGKPFPGVHLLILDSQHQLVPDGLPGEIHIGGAHLSAGYIGSQAGKNATAFIPHPLCAGERLYRTGDKGRRLPDGNVEFLGRIDRQVKIRGFRVELTEIEQILHQCPGVTLAAAALQPISANEHRLLVFLVGIAPAQRDAVKDTARARLPHYMHPDRWVWLDSMPLTASGKINYTALTTMTLPIGSSERRPRSETEHQLHHLYASVLDLNEVDIDDSFFQLGGNSINALKLVMQVNQQFGISLSLGQLLEHSSIHQLAQLLEQLGPQQALTSLVELNRGHDDQPTFLMVHPAGGNVLCYYPMVQALGSRYPVYGVQVADFSQAHDYDRDITSLAAFYLQHVGHIARRPKLIIGGWSLGATIALEMGQQIARSTGQAPTLLVFDQPAPQVRVDYADAMSDSDRLAYFASKVALFTGTRFDISGEKLSAMSEDDRTRLFLTEFRRARLVPSTLSFENFRHFLVILWAHINASDSYPGVSYAGPILVAEAQEILTGRIRLPEPGLGWQRLTDRPLTVVPAQGNHITMMNEPHIVELIQRIKQVLA